MYILRRAIGAVLACGDVFAHGRCSRMLDWSLRCDS